MININYKKAISEKSFSKSAHEYPKLDNIMENVPYAFSLSPRIQKESVMEQIDSDEIYIFDILKNCSYNLFPELSTKSINWHYHGTIQFKDLLQIVSFYFYTIRKLKEVCTFTIVDIEDEHWTLYCLKQRHYMFNLCHANNSQYRRTTKPNPKDNKLNHIIFLPPSNLIVCRSIPGKNTDLDTICS